MTALMATLQRVLRRALGPASQAARHDARARTRLGRPQAFACTAPVVFRSEAFPEDLDDANRSA